MTSTDSFKYVVVGAGNAAGYVARHFVLNDAPPNSLCLIGAEPVLPYERPALSKAFLTNDAVRLPGFHTSVGGGGDRQTAEWYESKSISTILAQSVTEFDASSKAVTLADGRVISATDALIFATGAAPIVLSRTPGHDLRGIHYLRDNADGLALADALRANVGKKVVVIGGGYIGMEVTAAAVTVGCKVTMVFPEDHMMPRLFTPEIAAAYEQVYKDKGVAFVNGGYLGKAFLGDGGDVRAVAVAGPDGADLEIEASLVVVGVGARPNTALLKGKVELDERGGALVDGALQTSQPGVYAIGDIATFPLRMYDNRRARMEHVQNARDMAAHVANVVCKGATEAYDYLPYFYSRVFHMAWQFFGDNQGECHVVSELDAATLREWKGEGKHPQMLAVWVEKGGALQGIFMESPSPDDTANMKRIARERPVVDVDAFNKCTTVEAAWKVIL